MARERELVLRQVTQAGREASRLRQRARMLTFRALRRGVAAGLSQRELASAVGRSQPEVSRLLKSSPRFEPASELGQKIADRRQDVYRILARSGASNPRIFGSVARGDDTESSDIDLLIDIPESFSLMDLAKLEAELENLLAAKVDVVPARGLHGRIEAAVSEDAVSL